MHKSQVPITALPAWCKLNDVNFLDIAVKDIGTKGFGLLTERALSSEHTFDVPTLIIIPRDLVLSAEAIEEHAKVDHHFRQLLDAVGGKSFRGDVLLFLLLQITIGSLEEVDGVGVSNPWTEYVKLLPKEIPVPTIWTEEERLMLLGTSLESALDAKMTALLREFETLREETQRLAWCQKCWWEEDSLRFQDWIFVDALYRSRCLELPSSGESLVPGLDMANHSSEANAFYEETASNDITLLLKPDVKLDTNQEITISYGASKSEAEMLFSYGFIDEKSTIASVVLTLEPFPDDPLGKAKLAAFAGPPIIRIFESDTESVRWESDFLYFLCLNEEDGLDFKVLQQIDGERSLRVFWQDVDVTEKTATFQELISTHELKEVFQLRVVALLQDRIRQQIETLYQSEDTAQSVARFSTVSSNRARAALQLRRSETAMLEASFAIVDAQKNELLENETVLEYLQSMSSTNEGNTESSFMVEVDEDEEDFS